MTDYTPSGKPAVGRAISKEIRSEFADRIAPAINSKANIASPTFTGTPIAPTASVGTSGGQIATVDYVNAVSFSTNLPGQASNNGKVIVTDGANASWTDTFTIPWTFNDTIAANATVTFADAINTARATVASHATTADIWGAAGNEIDFTGSEIITDFPDAPQAGVSRVLHIADAPTFTHNANIFLPNDSDYTAETGDIAIVHAVTTNTYRIVFHQVRALMVREKPIFSIETFNKRSARIGDNIALESYSTGLPLGDINIVFGVDLFVAYTSVVSDYVSTSPDCKVWTLRAMPSSNIWRVAYSNEKFLASGVTGGTTMAQSVNGIDWSTSPSLSVATSSNVSNTPVGIGNTRLIYSATGSYNISTDNGATWSVNSLPVSPSSPFFFVIGSNFVINTTTGFHYSTTGLTGSWVSVGGDLIEWLNPDGSAGANNVSNGIRRTTDGLTWETIIRNDVTSISPSNSHWFYIDGITGIWTTTPNDSYTFHGTEVIPRMSSRNIPVNSRISASNGSGVSAIGSDSGYVIRISDSLTSLFIL